MATGVFIQGLKELEDRIRKAPEVLQKEIGRELKGLADRVKRNAQRDAPKDQGRLIGSITTDTINNLNYEIISGADYSPYLEFGTGHKVRIEANLIQYAAQFVGRGTPGILKAKDAIYAWAKRVGIPKEGWYPVFRSIMRHGISPANHGTGFFFKWLSAQEQARTVRLIEEILDTKV